jgi:hypothetical protein
MFTRPNEIAVNERPTRARLSKSEGRERYQSWSCTQVVCSRRSSAGCGFVWVERSRGFRCRDCRALGPPGLHDPVIDPTSLLARGLTCLTVVGRSARLAASQAEPAKRRHASRASRTCCRGLTGRDGTMPTREERVAGNERLNERRQDAGSRWRDAPEHMGDAVAMHATKIVCRLISPLCWAMSR